MSETKRNVPKLRFPGFTEDWEQRKFSEITVNIGKRNKENLNLEPYAITKDDGFIPQAEAHDEFGYMKETDRKAYNIVKPNSFGYNPARINVGSIGYYSGTEDIIVSSLYEIFQTSENIYDRFLWHWFKSKQFQNWIERLQEGSVRLYFYYDKLCECEIFIPTVDEQIKIGNSLDRFDNLITLHQRKLENLKLKKKALLQKLFPKNGEQFPELRFPGFTDAWEQRKLGDLAKVEMDKRIYKEQTSAEGEIPFYKIGTFGGKADSYISEDLYNEYTRKYPHPKEGDILISASGSIGRTVVYHGEKAYFQDSNIVWLNHNGALDNGFLLQFYSRVKWAGLEGSTIKRLYNKNILETEINVPDIREQKNIGEFFTQVDNLITLHQRKLEHLQLQKKALLQQMFV